MGREVGRWKMKNKGTVDKGIREVVALMQLIRLGHKELLLIIVLRILHLQENTYRTRGKDWRTEFEKKGGGDKEGGCAHQYGIWGYWNPS